MAIKIAVVVYLTTLILYKLHPWYRESLVALGLDGAFPLIVAFAHLFSIVFGLRWIAMVYFPKAAEHSRGWNGRAPGKRASKP
jgi:hypothetical protein